MKTALVTGAGGWIGLELVKSLLDNNYIVKALVRKSNEDLEKLKIIAKENLNIIIGDMSEIEAWRNELENVDLLFHLAAKVHSKPNNKEEEKEFYLINRDYTNNLFDKAIEYNIKKVIFVSTVAVYGNHGDKIININSNRRPKTPYAISKNEAELYGMRLYKEKNFPLIIVQPVTVYGGRDRGNFKKLYDLGNKGILVKFGDGLNKKSIIYYKDLVKLMINLSENHDSLGKTFICGTENIEYNKILCKIKNESNAKIIFNVPKFISKTAIKILKSTRINKLNNLSQNINTLMCDNLYEYNEVNKYIENSVLFEKWNCREEYGK